MICEGCGVNLVLHRGKWAKLTPPRYKGDPTVWDFCCSVTYDGTGKVLLAAAYHFVAGEVQEHFVAEDV